MQRIWWNDCDAENQFSISRCHATLFIWMYDELHSTQQKGKLLEYFIGSPFLIPFWWMMFQATWIPTKILGKYLNEFFSILSVQNFTYSPWLQTVSTMKKFSRKLFSFSSPSSLNKATSYSKFHFLNLTIRKQRTNVSNDFLFKVLRCHCCR